MSVQFDLDVLPQSESPFALCGNLDEEEPFGIPRDLSQFGIRAPPSALRRSRLNLGGRGPFIFASGDRNYGRGRGRRRIAAAWSGVATGLPDFSHSSTASTTSSTLVGLRSPP